MYGRGHDKSGFLVAESATGPHRGQSGACEIVTPTTILRNHFDSSLGTLCHTVILTRTGGPPRNTSTQAATYVCRICGFTVVQ